MFVKDMDAIVGDSRLTDRILVLGDFNQPKVEWGVQEDGSTSLPMGITTDLDLGRINSIPNQNGTFLDLIF
jgi:hypothetical protein